MKIRYSLFAAALLLGVGSVSLVRGQDAPTSCAADVGRYQVALATGTLAQGSVHSIYEVVLDTCTGAVVQRNRMTMADFGK